MPLLWLYKVGNGLLIAYRRGVLMRLKAPPIDAARQTPSVILEFPLLNGTMASRTASRGPRRESSRP